MNRDTWIFLALCGGLLVFLLAASFLSSCLLYTSDAADDN